VQIEGVDVAGFRTYAPVNGRYTESTDDAKQLNGRATMWHDSGNYYIFWCANNEYFMIGVLAGWHANFAGGCLGIGGTAGTNQDNLLAAEYWLEYDGTDEVWARNDDVVLTIAGAYQVIVTCALAYFIFWFPAHHQTFVLFHHRTLPCAILHLNHLLWGIGAVANLQGTAALRSAVAWGPSHLAAKNALAPILLSGRRASCLILLRATETAKCKRTGRATAISTPPVPSARSTPNAVLMILGCQHSKQGRPSL
jgi:hypothetical protein